MAGASSSNKQIGTATVEKTFKFNVHPDWKLPSWNADEKKWTFSGKEALHPYWAVGHASAYKETNCAQYPHNLTCVVVGLTSPGCTSSVTHKVITQAIVNTKAISKGDELLLPEPAAVAARDQKKRDGWKRQLAVDSQPKAQAKGKAARLLDVGVQV